jgi:HAD superfamily hydrolase (TIGR01490 family)
MSSWLPEGRGKRTRAAFIDVDETLITVKSMFAFMRYWSTRSGHDCDDVMAELHAMAAGGVDRTEINRAYYRWYAGAAWTELLVAGEAWYEDFRGDGTPFVAATLAAVAAHRAAGDAVVLVSGSFRPCLEPLARDVRADLLLCTEPVIERDGRLSGEVREPMIGRAKATAVKRAMTALGVDPTNCAAYADHLSDLDMLSLVGHPVVVAGDSRLTVHARRHSWRVFPATATGG